jgi:hypothetical protein
MRGPREKKQSSHSNVERNTLIKVSLSAINKSVIVLTYDYTILAGVRTIWKEALY